MRLIDARDLGHVQFLSLWTPDRPPYAILSHTWSEDEILLQDFSSGTDYHTKYGYHKLQGLARLALEAGLQYVWMDTCCIDKSSSAELAEAINSMFTWYRHATVCIAYLSDVSLEPGQDSEASRNEWIHEFRSSRWFTRGWTLQELIAPEHLEFYSREWTPLGSKAVLAEEIQDITGIPVAALQGKSLDMFPAVERAS